MKNTVLAFVLGVVAVLLLSPISAQDGKTPSSQIQRQVVVEHVSKYSTVTFPVDTGSKSEFDLRQEDLKIAAALNEKLKEGWQVDAVSTSQITRNNSSVTLFHYVLKWP